MSFLHAEEIRHIRYAYLGCVLIVFFLYVAVHAQEKIVLTYMFTCHWGGTLKEKFKMYLSLGNGYGL